MPHHVISSIFLWHIGWSFEIETYPNRSEYMQSMKSETSLEKSDVHLLPITDMDPNNETCIYSTMIYVKEQALKLGLPTACITFDQPLWLKDVNINYSENLDIVVRLGGFHMLMSFLGSIGMSMEDSGLETVLGGIFADN